MFSKLIENLNHEGKTYERMLGGKGNRDTLAKFHSQNADKFQLIAVNLLHNFCTKNVFSKEEYGAFLSGILAFGTALDECRAESEADNKPIEGEVL